MRIKDKEILKDISQGRWEKAFPRKLYKAVTSWLATRTEPLAAIRIIFRCSIRKKRFACHLLCSTNISKGRIVVQDLCVPPSEYWVGCDERLVAVPERLYSMPIFSMPRDTLKRARRKYERQKNKEKRDT
jgi:hypothetical protein